MKTSRMLGAWVSGWTISSLLVVVTEMLFPPKNHILWGSPVAYLLSQTVTAAVLGLLSGLMYVSLFWLFVARPHRSRHLLLWSITLGLGLGLLFVGGWAGFLYAVLGHWPRGHSAALVAGSIVPYLLGGCAVGWLLRRQGRALHLTPLS